MSIQVKNVCFTYSIDTPNETNALKNINLEIKDNCFAAILGKTGSGKSTLIQHLNGLLLPTSGEIKVDDFVVLPKKNKNIKGLRKHLGIVFQFPEYQLFEETVEKDVAFGLKNFGVKEDEAIKKAREAILKVGLNESYFERSPFDLSGGEKRRVALAGILVLEPDILVLDEPTAGLDFDGVNQIMSIIQSMHNQGKSIILVTHDMNIVLKYVKDVYILKDGELVFEGKTEELFNNNFEKYGIEIPKLYSFAKKLKNKGFAIEIDKIRTINDLIEQIQKGSKTKWKI